MTEKNLEGQIVQMTYSTQFHIILLETEQSAIKNIVRTPSATNKCTARKYCSLTGSV